VVQAISLLVLDIIMFMYIHSTVLHIFLCCRFSQTYATSFVSCELLLQFFSALI
jgi:hypothetical protein